MKTYILRAPKTVEPQKAVRPQRRTPPPATACEVLGRPAQTQNSPVLFIGLDVHTDSIAVSLAPSDSADSALNLMSSCC